MGPNGGVSATELAGMDSWGRPRLQISGPNSSSRTRRGIGPVVSAPDTAPSSSEGRDNRLRHLQGRGRSSEIRGEHGASGRHFSHRSPHPSGRGAKTQVV